MCDMIVELSEPVLRRGWGQYVTYDKKHPPSLEHWEIVVTTFIMDRAEWERKILPQGWRYLEVGEIIIAEDRFLQGSNWKTVNMTGARYNMIGFPAHIREVKNDSER